MLQLPRLLHRPYDAPGPAKAARGSRQSTPAASCTWSPPGTCLSLRLGRQPHRCVIPPKGTHMTSLAHTPSACTPHQLTHTPSAHTHPFSSHTPHQLTQDEARVSTMLTRELMTCPGRGGQAPLLFQWPPDLPVDSPLPDGWLPTGRGRVY